VLKQMLDLRRVGARQQHAQALSPARTMRRQTKENYCL
jgi:hypothetical protein